MTINKRLEHSILKVYKILPVNIRFALSFLIARKFIVGIVAFVVKDSQLLLVKHSYQYPWALPGGFLKPNENFSTSIEREIKEETNLKVKLERIIEIKNNPQKPSMDIVTLCKFLGEKIKVDKVEVEEAKFFEIKSLPVNKILLIHQPYIKWFVQNKKKFLT